MRTEDRVIPDLLCGRDEHLVRDTEAPELRGRQGAAATHRAASVGYAASTPAQREGSLGRGSALSMSPLLRGSKL
jgi:hypothetical protein